MEFIFISSLGLTVEVGSCVWIFIDFMLHFPLNPPQKMVFVRVCMVLVGESRIQHIFLCLWKHIREWYGSSIKYHSNIYVNSVYRLDSFSVFLLNFLKIVIIVPHFHSFSFLSLFPISFSIHCFLFSYENTQYILKQYEYVLWNSSIFIVVHLESGLQCDDGHFFQLPLILLPLSLSFNLFNKIIRCAAIHSWWDSSIYSFDDVKKNQKYSCASPITTAIDSIIFRIYEIWGFVEVFSDCSHFSMYKKTFNESMTNRIPQTKIEWNL